MLLGQESVPRGLFESQQYFRHYGPIKFQNITTENGTIIAKSTNFRYGSIITEAKNKQTLEPAIIDAILTSFEIPSSYKKEAQIHNTATEKKGYAYA